MTRLCGTCAPHPTHGFIDQVQQPLHLIGFSRYFVGSAVQLGRKLGCACSPMAPNQDVVGPQQREDRKYCWVQGSHSSSFPHNGQLSRKYRCRDHAVCFLTCHAKSYMLPIHALVAILLWNLKTQTLHRHVRTEVYRSDDNMSTFTSSTRRQVIRMDRPSHHSQALPARRRLVLCRLLRSTSTIPLSVSVTSASSCTVRTIFDWKELFNEYRRQQSD